MVSPVCESAVGVLTYDTVGCLGKAGSPIGFDASGNLVCDKMTSKYIWPDLIDPYQANLTPEECSSRIIRLRFFNNLYVSCATPIPTNTPTSTPTNTNTPLVSPSATASSTPSATPTAATATPTYTPTDEIPTPTPTAPIACDFSGDPNDIWNVAMPSEFFNQLYSKDMYSPNTLKCKTTQWNEVYEANLGLDGLFGSPSYHPYEVVVNACHLAVAIRVIEEGYGTNHNHSHHTNPTHIGCPTGCTGASGHLKFAHSHCKVEIQPEYLGAGKFQLMSYIFDLEHATSYGSAYPCADLADTTKRAPNWKIKVEFVHNNLLLGEYGLTALGEFYQLVP